MAFFKAKQIPQTSYGYQAPPGATAHGWFCTNRDCSHSEHEPVKRWPFPCQECGSPTDPLFDEPWAHEARGIELQYILTNFPDRDGGYSAMAWPTWQYKEVMRHNKLEAAHQARLDARALEQVRSADSWWNPGSLYFPLLWEELEAEDIDGAADDLTHWLSITKTDDVENDNTNRTNSRQVIDMTLRFFNVDQAVTLDDRALHEVGHAIGVVSSGPGAHDRTQIGIAMDKRRVWQTGYARLADYAAWAASLCRDLERGVPVGQLGGLRIADSPLDPNAKPIAAVFDPFLDVNLDAEYEGGGGPVLFADAELTPLARSPGGDIGLSLVHDGTALATITYATDGQLLGAPGEFRRRGRHEELSDRLQRHPISVFFSDGSVMRGAGGCISSLGDEAYFAISDQPRALSATSTPLGTDNRFAILDQTTILLAEKDGNNTTTILAGLGNVTKATTPTSLFHFVVRQARLEGADFIFCDDGANEVADFVIGWRSHPRTSGPLLRLVHCKAMTPAERRRIAAGGQGVRGSGLKEAEEVSQQMLRSIAFLLRPPDTMLAQLERRAQGYPQRYVVGTRDTFDAVLSRDPASRTAEVWAVHPGLSRHRLLEARGRPLRTLLSAIRTRAIDARADVAVVGRA
jgi:hypothetical protein